MSFLQEVTEEDVHKTWAEERNCAMKSMMGELHDLQDIHHSLNTMVHKQGGQVETVDDQVATVLEVIDHTKDDIEEVHNSFKKKRSRTRKAIMLCGGVALGGIALAFASPVIGVLTACAGIGGGIVVAVQK